MKSIIVLQRGWVIVGDYQADGNECTVTNGSVIRNWGTKRGLGELAADGPQSGTVLDPIPTANFHPLTMVMRLQCSDKWQK